MAIPEVVATLLIQLPRASEEELAAWTPRPGSQSHPGDLSNLWIMYCYSNDAVKENLETLLNLGGVQNVAVAYGKTTWKKYAAEHGLKLEKHICDHNGCKGSGGSSLLGEVLYYTGPL